MFYPQQGLGNLGSITFLWAREGVGWQHGGGDRQVQSMFLSLSTLHLYCSLDVVTVLGVDDLSQGGEREILAVKSRWQILLRGQPGSCKGDLQVSNPLKIHQGLIMRPVQLLLLCLAHGHGLAAARRRRPPSVQVPLDSARLILPLLPLRQKTIKSYPHVRKGCCWSLC